MEALNSVRTIVGIAQDIMTALETASRNKSRCGKVAKRVRCLSDMVEQLHAALAETEADAATLSLLKRLEEALGDALRQARRCRRSSFVRSLILAGGGGRMADPLDEVESEINRCLLDLVLANFVRIARLEKLLREKDVAASTDDDGSKKDEGNAKVAAVGVPDSKADRAPVGSGAENGNKDEENATAPVDDDVAAIGVPVCAVTAGMHEHHMVPPPSYGYGYCCHDNAGGPYDCASYYSHYHSASYPSIFSDDNPNACSIM